MTQGAPQLNVLNERIKTYRNEFNRSKKQMSQTIQNRSFAKRLRSRRKTPVTIDKPKEQEAEQIIDIISSNNSALLKEGGLDDSYQQRRTVQKPYLA